MDVIDFPIEKLNKFLDDHIFVVPTNLFDNTDIPGLKTNIRIKLTGQKKYNSFGHDVPYIEYTIYILPTNELMDKINSIWLNTFAKKEPIITTTSSTEGYRLRNDANRLLENFFQYFGYDNRVICTKIVNGLNS